MKNAALAALVIATAAVTPLQAAGPGDGHRFAGGFGARFGDGPTTKIVEMMDKKLDLTDEQQAKIEAIMTATREKVEPLSKEIGETVKKSREEIAAILTDEQRGKIGEAKEDAFKGMAGFAAGHKEQIRERVQDAGEEIRMRVALQKLDLTAEQRGKLQEVNKEMREKQKEIQEAVKPQVEELRKEAKDKTAAVLTEEQKKELEDKLKEMPKHIGQGDRMRGPGGPEGRRGPGREGRPGGPPPHREPRNDGGADTFDQQ